MPQTASEQGLRVTTAAPDRQSSGTADGAALDEPGMESRVTADDEAIINDSTRQMVARTVVPGTRDGESNENVGTTTHTREGLKGQLKEKTGFEKCGGGGGKEGAAHMTRERLYKHRHSNFFKPRPPPALLRKHSSGLPRPCCPPQGCANLAFLRHSRRAFPSRVIFQLPYVVIPVFS